MARNELLAKKVTQLIMSFTVVLHFYCLKRSCEKVIFLHLSVSHSVHGGGVYKHAMGRGCVSQDAISKGWLGPRGFASGQSLNRYIPHQGGTYIDDAA